MAGINFMDMLTGYMEGKRPPEIDGLSNSDQLNYLQQLSQMRHPEYGDPMFNSGGGYALAGAGQMPKPGGFSIMGGGRPPMYGWGQAPGLTGAMQRMPDLRSQLLENANLKNWNPAQPAQANAQGVPFDSGLQGGLNMANKMTGILGGFRR